MLQREIEPATSQKTDATAAFLASLEEPKLTSLAEAGKKPPIEILPPGMMSLSAPISIQKKPGSIGQIAQQPQGKPLALEAPPTAKAEPPNGVPLQQSESTPAPVSDPPHSQSPPDSTADSAAAPSQLESGETVDDIKEAPTSASASDSDKVASEETVQVGSTSNPVPTPTPTPSPTEVPPQVAEIQPTNVPTIASVSDFLA